MESTIEMFDSDCIGGRQKIDVLPVSVIEVNNQNSVRRTKGGHNANSSRNEYSHFPLEVGSLCMQLYLKNSVNIFDPFAGWGERHADAITYGKNYTGYDVSSEAIQEAKRIYGVDNVLADSLVSNIPKFDGMITCPPYWNLEIYGGAGIEKLTTYSDFIENGLSKVFIKCYESADNSAVFCIMVGDWRNDGIYYDLAHKTRCIMNGLGAITVDEVVISRRSVTKIKIMIPQAIRLGYTVKVHETLLVFRKP
jgi:DNA modification methylase